MDNSLLLDEYSLAFDLFEADREFTQRVFQLECGLINESVGLISIDESFMDTLKNWFEKICNGVDGAINKLKMKLTERRETLLKDIEDKLTNPNRPNPEMFKIEITNYHTYDYTKFKSYTAGKFFQDANFLATVAAMVGNGQSKVKNKDEVIKQIYPDLYDEKIKVFDKMVDNVLTSEENGQTTYLTNDMLDDCVNFLTNTYRDIMNSIEQDREAIKSQKKNVDTAVNAMMDADKATKMANQNIPNNESYMCESYLIINEEIKAGKVNTKPVTANAPGKTDDKGGQKISSGDTGDNRVESRSSYVKAYMAYISAATEVISCKAKIINRIFNDKYHIVKFYARKCEWKLSKSEKRREGTRRDRKDVKQFRKQLNAANKK